MAFTSSSFVVGFASPFTNDFKSFQTNSIGFKSGDSAGVRCQLIPALSMATRAAVCLGSLSGKKGEGC